MISLTIGAVVIELPAGFVWADEYTWAPVVQKAEIAVTGALIVQEGAQSAGRPITLMGGEDACWITRADLVTLYASMQTAGQQMTLTLHDSRAFTVMWRRDPQPIEAVQLLKTEAPDDTTLYIIESLKFIEAGT